jgi:hypothetical protein
MAAETPVTPETSPQTATSAAAGDSEVKVKTPEERSSPSPLPGAGATPAAEAPRVDVSASTITRMMGIASSNDLRLLESRLDVLTSKVAGLVAKVERVLSMFSGLPSSSDMDRLELQVGTVKSMVRDLSDSLESVAKRSGPNEKQVAAEQSKKIRDGIKSNHD